MGKSKIEWTDETWQIITAAKRIGISMAEYVSKRSSGMKWCYLCKEWHHQSLFTIDRSRGDGLASSCRGRANKSPVPILTLEEKRVRANAAYRRYYASEAGASIRARVYARKRNLEAIPPWWRDEVMSQGCAYCGGVATTIDHVWPVSKGGDSDPGNLVPACVSCNSKKRDSHPLPWLERMRPEFLENILVRPMGGNCIADYLGN